MTIHHSQECCNSNNTSRDWRKPDLSTEVIAFAAPTVENVHLYWSGNQAVLRAWDCDEGIPRLYVTTERRLKRVTVYAAPVSLILKACTILPF